MHTLFPELQERVQHVPNSAYVFHQNLKLDWTFEFHLQYPKPYWGRAAVQNWRTAAIFRKHWSQATHANYLTSGTPEEHTSQKEKHRQA